MVCYLLCFFVTHEFLYRTSAYTVGMSLGCQVIQGSSKGHLIYLAEKGNI